MFGWTPVKAQALLAYLAVRPGQRHPRDKLAALLWGDSGEAQARDSLKHTLAALRRAFASAAGRVLIAEGQSFALDPQVMDVDVGRFERGVAEATPEAQRELGAEPEAETKQLYQEILQRRAPETPSSAPSPAARPPSEAPATETPIIGREGELRRLAELLEDAWKGSPRLAVVVGEAGIGKTRLVEELGARAVARSGHAIDASPADALPLAVRVTLGRLFPELTPTDLEVPQDPDNPPRLFEALSQLAAAVAARAAPCGGDRTGRGDRASRRAPSHPRRAQASPRVHVPVCRRAVQRGDREPGASAHQGGHRRGCGRGVRSAGLAEQRRQPVRGRGDDARDRRGHGRGAGAGGGAGERAGAHPPGAWSV